LAGFRARARRYFMYYKHEPGRTMRVASHPGLFRLYRTAMSVADLSIGRWGNKLQVTALRGQLIHCRD
jgi:hypothetical protein